MELFILGTVLWYTFGVAVFLRTCYVIQDFLLGVDFVLAVLAGVLGPLTLGYYFIYAKSDFAGRRFFEKKE